MPAYASSTPNIRKALRKLREIDLVEQIGGRGRPAIYRRLVKISIEETWLSRTLPAGQVYRRTLR
jgi:hypothetical protein